MTTTSVSDKQEDGKTQEGEKPLVEYISKYLEGQSCSDRYVGAEYGYVELQKKYPHKLSDFNDTKKTMEQMLEDAKTGNFDTSISMQLVMDYLHWWYFDVDPNQYYKTQYNYYDKVKRVWYVTILEHKIRDIVAHILDELQHTGGTAYASLHMKRLV